MAESKATTATTPETATGGETATAAPAVSSKPRRTKLVQVQQRYIDCLLKRVPRKPFPTLGQGALLKRLRDEDNAILEQYHAYGFAMQEVQIRDDGHED